MEAFDGQVALLAVCHGASPQIRAALDCEAIDGLEAVWQVDVVGTLRLCQDVGSLMEQQRDGAIVIVSSLHAKMTYPQRLAYSISKASICAMARSLALEWGEFDIRVNSISPWQTSGERTQFFIDKEFKENGNDLLDAYHAKSPLKRLVSPRDIAETIIYLANNTSITGQDIVLDCGVSSSMWYKDY
jgi:NAD(P)-dependent dehydrogenase (short-subunit alcohol dehydrogenase family)